MPRKGTKTYLSESNHKSRTENQSMPRKGTETYIRSRCSISNADESIYAPQGDGNNTHRCPRLTSLANQSMPRKGTETASVYSNSNSNPESIYAPQGDGNI